MQNQPAIASATRWLQSITASMKAMQNQPATSGVLGSQPPSGTKMSGRASFIRCSVDSMRQTYADGRIRVVLAVRPESVHHAPKLRLSDGRIPITLRTPVGDFEAGIRAWSSGSDRPYVCPDLRSKTTGQKETLARVLEHCGIRTGSIINLEISGSTWRIAPAV